MFITVGIEIQHTDLCKEKQVKKKKTQSTNVLATNMLVLEKPPNMEAVLEELKTAPASYGTLIIRFIHLHVVCIIF